MNEKHINRQNRNASRFFFIFNSSSESLQKHEKIADSSEKRACTCKIKAHTCGKSGVLKNQIMSGQVRAVTPYHYDNELFSDYLTVVTDLYNGLLDSKRSQNIDCCINYKLKPQNKFKSRLDFVEPIKLMECKRTFEFGYLNRWVSHKLFPAICIKQLG